MLDTMRQLGAAICFGAVGAAVNAVERDALQEGSVRAGLRSIDHIGAERTRYA